MSIAGLSPQRGRLLGDGMTELLAKYLDDPKLRPLILEYESSDESLETLKTDLRTMENIDRIILLSQGHAGIKNELRRLIGVRQKEITEGRLRKISLIARILLIVLGSAYLVALLAAL